MFCHGFTFMRATCQYCVTCLVWLGSSLKAILLQETDLWWLTRTCPSVSYHIARVIGQTVNLKGDEVRQIKTWVGVNRLDVWIGVFWVKDEVYRQVQQGEIVTSLNPFYIEYVITILTMSSIFSRYIYCKFSTLCSLLWVSLSCDAAACTYWSATLQPRVRLCGTPGPGKKIGLRCFENESVKVRVYLCSGLFFHRRTFQVAQSLKLGSVL